MSTARIDVSDGDADTGAATPSFTVPSEMRAVEVRGSYRGVVTSARILAFPTNAGRHATGTKMLLGGVTMALISLALFIATAVGVGRERRVYESWRATEKPSQGLVSTSLGAGRDASVLIGLLCGGVLAATGLRRRGKTSPHFTVGSDAGVDAPIPSEFVRWPAHPLVQAAGGDYVVNVTQRMTGTVDDKGRVYSLADFTRRRGASFPLPASGSTHLDCGATTFVITRTSRPRALPVPLFTWDARQQRYTVGSVVALALGVVLMSFVPSDPRALSLDLLNTDSRFVRFQISPPEVSADPLPVPLDPKNPGAQAGSRGDKGARAVGKEGQMGNKSSRDHAKQYAIKGRQDTTDFHLAKTLEASRAANTGILGVLNRAEGSHIASIFGSEAALGRDAENVLGGLLPSQIGDAYGIGGMGIVGTGEGGGGPNEGLIGRGGHRTLGRWGGGDSDSSYGVVGVGDLHRRRAIAPNPMPGIVVSRGSLDKEIVRRIIRRHINEIRNCYEQELMKNPNLGGRIMVQFTIAAGGQVISSIVQNSTMGNIGVESCTVQAVRRWEFPKPAGGGLVIVSYPFVLAAAGN